MAAHRPRISLKWKTLALLGLALIVVNGSLTLYTNQKRDRAFQALQQREVAQQLHALERLLQRSGERLQRIGSIVPNLLESLQDQGTAPRQWETLQLELELRQLSLLDAQGQVILSAGEPPSAAQAAVLKTSRQQALAQERPQHVLICHGPCLQFALVPNLGRDGERRVMLMAADMGDLVLQFQALTGANLALFGDTPSALSWQDLGLAALSNAPENMAMMEAVTQHFSAEQLSQKMHFLGHRNHLRFSAHPWAALGGQGPGYMVIFENVDEGLRRNRTELRQNLVTSLAALSVTLILGYIILNRPMNQLRRLAKALPMLADRQYQEARDLIGTGSSTQAWPSETDVLESLTIALSDQLEALQKTVQRRNEDLARHVAELRRSQGLNETILATAPIAILMLSGEGRIVKANAFTCNLLGYSDAELRRENFLDLLDDPRQRREAGNVLVDLIAGRSSSYEHIVPVRCIDGSQEQMVWMHSRVLAPEGVFVLTVGLPDRAGASNET